MCRDRPRVGPISAYGFSGFGITSHTVARWHGERWRRITQDAGEATAVACGVATGVPFALTGGSMVIGWLKSLLSQVM